MKPIYSISFLVILLSFSSCIQKEEIITNEHTNVIVDDVTAPPYASITTVQIHNYINKLYIDLIGREPVESELNEVTSYFRENELSETSREQVVGDLMNTAAYYDRLSLRFRIQYINGVSPEYFDYVIYEFETAYGGAIFNGDITYAQYLNYELDKLYDLVNAAEDYKTGAITISEYAQRIVFNDIYDEINMGSENFVLSCFENFLKRFPTDTELVASVEMVDGAPSQLLQTDGINKLDFIKIITTSAGFFEGLTIDIYNQLLARDPNSSEMTNYTIEFLDGKTYQEIQTAVLRTDEYAGF